ncbi:MAG: hypothetical protein SH809_02320 [Rhodothermales bacterium]|nr:hypothetical protein [Rhodothermales bacterium]
MTPVQQDLLIAEYNALRAENLLRIDHLAAQARHILVLNGASWAWMLTQDELLTRIAYWIPLLITLLFWANNFLTIKTIRRVSGYLKHMTEKVDLPHELGWERYLKTHPLGHMSRWTFFFWIVLVVGNFVLPIYLMIAK